MRRALLLGLLPALVVSCSSANTLDGSLSDEVSLAFDGVEIQRADGAVAVVYEQSLAGGGGHDTILEITATTSGVDLTKAVNITLTDEVDGQQRGAATRAVSGDDRRDLPPLVRGFLKFDAAPTVGQTVTGSFSVLFDQGGDVGAGRTAYGDFQAKVTEATP